MNFKNCSLLFLSLFSFSVFAQSMAENDSPSDTVIYPSFFSMDFGESLSKGALPLMIQFGISDRKSFQIGLGPTLSYGIRGISIFSNTDYGVGVAAFSKYKYYFRPWEEGRRYSMYGSIGYQVGSWNWEERGSFLASSWNSEYSAIRHFVPLKLGVELRSRGFYMDCSVGPNLLYESVDEYDRDVNESSTEVNRGIGAQVSWQIGFQLN